MNKYVTITINQVNDNGFEIKLVGNCEDLLKGLAGAVAQTVDAAPESLQQYCRSRFLQYFNQATIELHMEDI